MGREALDAAIANYHGLSYENSHDDGELVCHCFGVGVNKIKKVVWENHLTTVEEVTDYTKAGGGCGTCKMRIEQIIDEVWVDLEKCGVPRPGHAPTPIPSITITTSTEAPSSSFSSISTVTSSSAAEAAVDAASESKTKSSPIYNEVQSILNEISNGFTDGSKVELASITGNDVAIKLSGPIANGMMKDMTVGFVKQKLSDGTGRLINISVR
ncbi:MAG: (2Fe-2S)-binding protein, partial [Succinivibrio sp.]